MRFLCSWWQEEVRSTSSRVRPKSGLQNVQPLFTFLQDIPHVVALIPCIKHVEVHHNLSRAIIHYLHSRTWPTARTILGNINRIRKMKKKESLIRAVSRDELCVQCQKFFLVIVKKLKVRFSVFLITDQSCNNDSSEIEIFSGQDSYIEQRETAFIALPFLFNRLQCSWKELKWFWLSTVEASSSVPNHSNFFQSQRTVFSWPTPSNYHISDTLS